MKKLLLLTLLIAGCGSSYYVKRDIKHLDGLSLQYPNEFAKLSNMINPCFTGAAKSDTVVKHTSDTIVTAGIERLVPGRPGKPDTLYFRGKTIRNNIYTTIHDTVTDNRALNASHVIAKSAADSLIIIKTQNAELKIDKSSLIKWVIGLAVVLFSVLGFSIYKFFSGGAILGTVKNIIWR
jgi:hypothetical protein